MSTGVNRLALAIAAPRLAVGLLRPEPVS